MHPWPCGRRAKSKGGLGLGRTWTNDLQLLVTGASPGLPKSFSAWGCRPEKLGSARKFSRSSASSSGHARPGAAWRLLPRCHGELFPGGVLDNFLLLGALNDAQLTPVVTPVGWFRDWC